MDHIPTPHTLQYTLDGIEHSLQTSNRLDETLYESPGSSELKISPAQHKLCAELKHMLRWWKVFAETHEIPWWMTAGSLLGTMRHQGLIPWDNDIDICIISDDYDMTYQDKMTALMGTHMTTHGTYEIRRCICGFRVYPVGKSFPFMDIWQYGKEKESSTTYTYSGPMNVLSTPHTHTHYTASNYPKFFHTLDELDVRVGETSYGISYGTFEGIELPIPNNSIQCIERWYGERAMIELYYDDHVDSHDGLNVRHMEKFVRFMSTIQCMMGLNPGGTHTYDRNQLIQIMGKHGLEWTDADLSKLWGLSAERVLGIARPKNPKEVVMLADDLAKKGARYIKGNLALWEAVVFGGLMPKDK
jgi:hypothetical protein